MNIVYANTHRWRKTISTSGIDGLSESSVRKIKSTLKKISDSGISYDLELIDQTFLSWFIPMYETRINEKDNPRVFNITEKTLGSKNQYYSLTLRENGDFLGATIFRFTENNICNIAYRTYENSWRTAKLQAKPSLLTEYLICQHAFEKNYLTISHGQDKNPYGLNSNIGLAAFKLSAGCKPETPAIYETDSLNTAEMTTDALVFEYPGACQTAITRGYLITSRATEAKWQQVTKYPHLVEVETIYRD